MFVEFPLYFEINISPIRPKEGEGQRGGALSSFIFNQLAIDRYQPVLIEHPA